MDNAHPYTTSSLCPTTVRRRQHVPCRQTATATTMLVRQQKTYTYVHVIYNNNKNATGTFHHTLRLIIRYTTTNFKHACQWTPYIYVENTTQKTDTAFYSDSTNNIIWEKGRWQFSLNTRTRHARSSTECTGIYVPQILQKRETTLERNWSYFLSPPSKTFSSDQSL